MSFNGFMVIAGVILLFLSSMTYSYGLIGQQEPWLSLVVGIVGGGLIGWAVRDDRRTD